MSTKTISLLLALASPLLLRAQQGLQAEYFNGKDFNQKVTTRIDPAINFVWNNVPPVQGMDPHVFSVRWTGKLKAPETGKYLFRAHVDDGIRVMLNGKIIIDAWGMHDSERFMGEIVLNAGQQYNLQVDYFNALLEGEIQLFWQLPSEAPVFQGLLGYNDHPIEGRFYTPPPQAAPQALKVQPAPSKPRLAAAKPPGVALKPAPIAKDTLEKYLPKNVQFVKSKSIILPESEPELERLAGFLLRNPRYRLSIEGHTDRIGNAAKNQILSEQRAQTVASFLIQKGIEARRISTKGYGDTKPLVKEADGVPNAANRRVAFFIQE